jgi:type VI secretion system protein ImpI
MTLRLILETAPHPQTRSDFRLADGQLVIGRGDECDWKIDDPQMFVSRRHCVIAGQGGQYRVTDESRGGLFLDTSTSPLGTGVTVPLLPGMRLRLGDFVIRAELEAAAVAPMPAARNNALFGDDFFTPRPEAPQAPRPASLPDPFDAPRSNATAPATAPTPPSPAFFDDPFTMDPSPRSPVANPVPMPTAPKPDFDFGDFGLPASLAQPKPAPPRPTPPPPEAPTELFGFELPAIETLSPPVQARTGSGAELPPAASDPPTAGSTIPDPEALTAFFRGLGIDPPPGFSGSSDEMEALGRRFRLMTEGLVHLLRMRAQEKGSARVAQTMVGAANVNPLKFLVGTEDAVSALVSAKGPGYLEPDAAIAAALHDLMDHHKRSWTGLQSSLRRMIDRFDPAIFESEVEEVGMLRALVAGSRAARLWQLYVDRYREIARAAEDRFLGEVGADFRDAYENETKGDN